MESAAGLTPWRSAAAQVLVSDLDSPELEPDDLHHLQRVLRLRVGQEVCATNGSGGWRSCAFSASQELEALGETHQELAPEYPVTVGFAVVKGERPELIVQKLNVYVLNPNNFFRFSDRKFHPNTEPSENGTEVNRPRTKLVSDFGR